jgi:hypothetical protein
MPPFRLPLTTRTRSAFPRFLRLFRDVRVLRDFRDMGYDFRGEGLEWAWFARYLEEDGEVCETETARRLWEDGVSDRIQGECKGSKTHEQAETCDRVHFATQLRSHHGSSTRSNRLDSGGAMLSGSRVRRKMPG